VRKPIVAVAALALALLATPASAAPLKDQVTGTITGGSGRSAVGFTFDAASGPGGEAPSGTVRIFGFISGDLGAFEISCLGVRDNRATVVAPFPDTQPPTPAGAVIHLEDNGPTGDQVDWTFPSTLPSTCPPPETVADDSSPGDVTVVDAPGPTLYSDCRMAGWVAYGFASHAQCIESAHALARRKCIFERAAHGLGAFRLKYGLGPNHDHAMRRCVRLYTGF